MTQLTCLLCQPNSSCRLTGLQRLAFRGWPVEAGRRPAFSLHLVLLDRLSWLATVAPELVQIAPRNGLGVFGVVWLRFEHLVSHVAAIGLAAIRLAAVDWSGGDFMTFASGRYGFEWYLKDFEKEQSNGKSVRYRLA